MNAAGLSAYLDLGLFRKAFLWLSAATLLLVFIDGFWIHFAKSKPAPTFAGISGQKVTPKLEPESSYLKAFEANTLFGDVVSGASTPVLKASLTELVKDYRLKGVVLTDEPEAIVEDARTQKTSFVKAGEPLGDLTVKEVKEGMVVLDYLGEEVQLEIQGGGA